MKIGITYLYIIYRYGYPHSVEDLLKGLPEVRKLGFRYLEMEGLGVQHMTALDRARKEVLARLADNGLQVHNFCVVDPNLVSLDARKRAKAMEGFARGAELGDFLGAHTLHLASYAPPVRYVDARPYELGKGYSFTNTTRVAIPRGFDWEQVWSALVDSCQACADVAAKHRMIVLMEPRVGETICSVDSMLRLIEYVGRPNFKANFDTGHFGAQRENVPLALEKLRGKFANIHIADNNPVNSEHLPIGDGVIDWREFFRVLKGMKYNGYLGLDLGARRTLVADYRKSVKRLRAIASQLKVQMEV